MTRYHDPRPRKVILDYTKLQRGDIVQTHKPSRTGTVCNIQHDKVRLEGMSSHDKWSEWIPLKHVYNLLGHNPNYTSWVEGSE